MRLDSKKPNAYRIACVLVIVIIAILYLSEDALIMF